MGKNKSQLSSPEFVNEIDNKPGGFMIDDLKQFFRTQEVKDEIPDDLMDLLDQLK